jgi:hypothetical protein
MIEASFEFSPDSLAETMRSLMTLPVELRPTHVSAGEGEKKSFIASTDALIESAVERRPGPYLTNHGCIYDISVPGTKSIICACFLPTTCRSTSELMKHMTLASPAFGFVAAEEERLHRNRVATKLGENTIESWVGRDITRYLPGIYWMTYVSNDLIRRHDLSTKPVEAIAKEVIRCPDGAIFRLYDDPDEWARSKDKVDELCFAMHGVFSINRVIPLVKQAKNYLELSDLLSDWR